MTGTPWEKADAQGPEGMDPMVLVRREPGSFLRGALLAWQWGAELAFDDAPTPRSLFPQQRTHESEVDDEELQQELSPELLAFHKRCRRSAALERQLFFALRHGRGDTAQVALEALKDAETNGLRYVLNRASEAGSALGSRARQVRVELHRLKGLVRFVPVTVEVGGRAGLVRPGEGPGAPGGTRPAGAHLEPEGAERNGVPDELLVGRAETAHHVADLLVLYFRERFGPSSACLDCPTLHELRAAPSQLTGPAWSESDGVTRIVLLVGDRAYISGEAGQVLSDDAAPFRQALAQDDFERFWLAYYGSQTIPRRAKPRLRQQRLPKRYWGWVLEAAQFASDGS